jgi:hypothetical protein
MLRIISQKPDFCHVSPMDTQLLTAEVPCPYLRPSISSQNSGTFCNISSSAIGSFVR